VFEHLGFTQTWLTDHEQVDIRSNRRHYFFIFQSFIVLLCMLANDPVFRKHFSEVLPFTFKSVVCTPEQRKQLPCLYKFIAKNTWTNRLDEQWEEVAASANFVDHV
jgi:hypothetical protein